MLNSENKWPSIVFYRGESNLSSAKYKLLFIKRGNLPNEIEQVNNFLLHKNIICEYTLISDKNTFHSFDWENSADVVFIYSDNECISVDDLLLKMDQSSFPIPVVVVSSELEKNAWNDWFFHGATDILSLSELNKLPYAAGRALMSRRYVKDAIRKHTYSYEDERRIKSLYEISAYHYLSYENQLNELLRIATKNLNLDTGMIGKVKENYYEILYLYSSTDTIFHIGMQCTLENTVCSITYQADDVVAFAYMGNTPYVHHNGYKTLKLETYIGVPIYVNNKRFGTLNFTQKKPRQQEFSQADKEWVKLLGRWIGGILEKQLMQKALEESEDRHRFIVEQQTEMICRFLPDTTLVFVNKAYCQFFKTAKEQLIGKKFIDVVPEHARQGVYDNLQKVKEAKKSFPCEHEVHNPDGSLSWQQWVDHPIINPDGEVEEFLSVGRDITKIKEAQHQNMFSMVKGENRERIRLASDLHDGLGQTLTAANLLLNSLRNHTEHFQQRQKEIFQNIQGLVQQAMKECRNISHNLMPKGLEDFGLQSALEQFIKTIERTGDISFHLSANFPRKVRFNRDVEINIYRMVQEAVSNIVKHSEATEAYIRLIHDNNKLHIVVHDNGKGFDPYERTYEEGIGLQSIRQRVQALRGNHIVDSSPGNGTSLYWDIPDINLELAEEEE